MWLIIGLIFVFAAIFSGDTTYWIVFALMVMSHNIEWVGIQLKTLTNKTKGA